MVEIEVLDSPWEGIVFRHPDRKDGFFCAAVRAQCEVKAAALCSGVNLFLDFSRTSMTFAQVTILCMDFLVWINYKLNVSDL